jgi:hypothetical protein
MMQRLKHFYLWKFILINPQKSESFDDFQDSTKIEQSVGFQHWFHFWSHILGGLKLDLHLTHDTSVKYNIYTTKSIRA